MANVSQSRRLRLVIEIAKSPLNAACDAFWNHPRLGEFFTDYLVTLHGSMRATVPLLETAARRARDMSGSDEVAAALEPYLWKHAREEFHHDEWLLEDLQLLGIDPEEALARMPSREIADLMGAQYYWVHHAHPVALLGCFAVLEGDPPRAEILDDIVERTGIPREALRTIYAGQNGSGVTFTS